MAKQHVCDGTGEAIAEESPTTGHLGRQYSDEARVNAEAYLAELDDLHTKHASAFSAELAELRQRYHGLLTTLPDEP